MKTTVLSRLKATIPTRMLRENSSLISRYSEAMSTKRININTVSFFITKRRLRSSSRPLEFYMLGGTILAVFIELVATSSVLYLPKGYPDVFLDIEL